MVNLLAEVQKVCKRLGSVPRTARQRTIWFGAYNPSIRAAWLLASIVFKLDQALDLDYNEDNKMSDHLGKLNALINQIWLSEDLTINKLHVVLMLKSLPQNIRWNRVITNLKAMHG
jgi:hypothetical protein